MESAHKLTIRQKLVNGRSIFIRDVEVTVRSNDESFGIVTDANAPSDSARGFMRGIDAVENGGTHNSIDCLSGGNREWDCGQQVEVTGFAGRRIDVERELLHARRISNGAAPRPAINQSVKHIGKS